MSRISDLIERIEKLARKFGCSIEEVIDILEGKHPTHCVTAKPEPVAENPTAGTNAANDVGNAAAQAGQTSAQSPDSNSSNTGTSTDNTNTPGAVSGDMTSAGAGATGGAGGQG